MRPQARSRTGIEKAALPKRYPDLLPPRASSLKPLASRARIIAIGDVHGYSAALDAVLTAIAPAADDTLVTLGDYVDRGPDSQGGPRSADRPFHSCRLIPILGNHDEMMLIGHGKPAGTALVAGDRRTVRRSIRMATADRSISFPTRHFEFLASCLPLPRNRHPPAAARQLRSGPSLGRARSADDSLAIAARFGSRPSLFGQDGDPRVTRRPARARFLTSAISNASTPTATAAAG